MFVPPSRSPSISPTTSPTEMPTENEEHLGGGGGAGAVIGICVGVVVAVIFGAVCYVKKGKKATAPAPVTNVNVVVEAGAQVVVQAGGKNQGVQQAGGPKQSLGDAPASDAAPNESMHHSVHLSTKQAGEVRQALACDGATAIPVAEVLPAAAGPAAGGNACDGCGAALAAGAKFCQGCGAKQVPKCTCGAEIAEGTKFCPSCGAACASPERRGTRRLAPAQ